MSYQMAFDEIDFGGGERAIPTARLLGKVLEVMSKDVFDFADFEKGGFTDITAKKWLDELKNPEVILAFHAGISAQRGCQGHPHSLCRRSGSRALPWLQAIHRQASAAFRRLAISPRWRAGAIQRAD